MQTRLWRIGKGLVVVLFALGVVLLSVGVSYAVVIPPKATRGIGGRGVGITDPGSADCSGICG